MRKKFLSLYLSIADSNMRNITIKILVMIPRLALKGAQITNDKPNMMPRLHQHISSMISTIKKKSSLVTPYDKAALILICSGLIFRAKHFLTNCSLWADELWFGIGIAGRSWLDIFSGQEIFPTSSRAPLIFNLIEKFNVTIFGNHEWALRLFPFFCGTAALFIFYLFLRRIKNDRTAFIALFLFALSPILIYFSAEAKQYSLDLAAAVTIFWLTEYFPKKNYSLKFLLGLGLLGALCIWTSNASLFVLASIGTVLFTESIINRQWRDTLTLSAAFLSWTISFAALYFFSLRHMVHNDILSQYWSVGFAPSPLTPASTLSWIQNVFLKMFNDPAALSSPSSLASSLWPLDIILPLLFFTGSIPVFKQNTRRFFFLSLPFLFLLLAGLIRAYPFEGRVIVFMVPAILIFLASGIDAAARKCRQYGNIIIVALIFLIFPHSLHQTASAFLTDYCREENREIFQIIREEFQPNDLIFFSPHGHFAFWYYAGQNGMFREPGNRTASKNDPLNSIRVGHLYHDTVDYKNETVVLFRYGMDFYNANGDYQSSLFEKKIDFILKDRPFMYDITRPRVWIFASGWDQKNFDITVNSFDLRWEKHLEKKYKEAYIALFNIE